MSMRVFKLEEYLAKYEFSAPWLLCCSDAESFAMQDIIAMAADEKALWDDLRLGYSESQGLPVLREQIASGLYAGMDASNILCFAGAGEGIFCALHTLCQPGDHVIVLTPGYQSLVEVPQLKGAEVTAIALREENAWRIDVDEIRQAIKQNTNAILINFPHNPTGQVITQQELTALVALCERHDLWLFSDEVYRLLGHPDEPWACPAAQIYPKALSLGVMSKAFGMAGLRVGWIACQDKALLKAIGCFKHYTSICNGTPSEIISLIALKNKDRILARNNQIVAENLRLLDHFILEYQQLFDWIRPQGGCTGFINYKGVGSIDEFSQRLVQEKGVLLMPASIYFHPSQHFRVGFGRKNMPDALNRLKEFLI